MPSAPRQPREAEIITKLDKRNEAVRSINSQLLQTFRQVSAGVHDVLSGYASLRARFLGIEEAEVRENYEYADLGIPWARWNSIDDPRVDLLEIRESVLATIRNGGKVIEDLKFPRWQAFYSCPPEWMRNPNEATVWMVGRRETDPWEHRKSMSDVCLDLRIGIDHVWSYGREPIIHPYLILSLSSPRDDQQIDVARDLGTATSLPVAHGYSLAASAQRDTSGYYWRQRMGNW
jgi:hypothetical protein